MIKKISLFLNILLLVLVAYYWADIFENNRFFEVQPNSLATLFLITVTPAVTIFLYVKAEQKTQSPITNNITVIIQNIVLLGLSIWAWYDIISTDYVGGAPIQLILIALFFTSSSIFIIFSLRPSASDSWLALWYKRKRLEERNKIEALLRNKQ